MGAIYLIRHGQASFGKADYDQLSPVGLEQARVLGTALKARVVPDAVFRGSMRRHEQTAEACLEAMGLSTVPLIDEGFNEYDHEEILVRYKPLYANKLLMKADLAKTLNPRKTFQAVLTEALERWMAGGENDYRESWAEFQTRCWGALQAAIDAAGPRRNLLVFTSGGVISVIAQRLLSLSDAATLKLQWTLANAAVTKVLYGSESGRLHLSTLNEHAHFEGANAALITYR